MSKQHRDFVIFVRNGVAINALVAFSQSVITPATQNAPASEEEHLTVTYLDPDLAPKGIPSGNQIRDAIKTQFSVPPFKEGLVFYWKDVEDRIEGSPREVVEAVQFGAASEEIARLRKQAVDIQTESDELARAQEITIANLRAEIEAHSAPPVNIGKDASSAATETQPTPQDENPAQ